MAEECAAIGIRSAPFCHGSVATDFSGKSTGNAQRAEAGGCSARGSHIVTQAPNVYQPIADRTAKKAGERLN